MGDLKSVLLILTKHLNFLLGTHVTPDHFKLAKLDKTQNHLIPTFWHLLSKFLSKITSDKITDIDSIKSALKALNYRSKKFYFLPADGASGSRELLVALAFILAKFLDEIVSDEVRNSPFDKDYNFLEEVLGELQENGGEMNKERSKRKKYQKWVQGKIDLNERMARDYRTHIDKFLVKMTKSLAVEDLNLNEALALCNEKFSGIFVEKSDRVLGVLENHKRWVKVEQVFWQWIMK